jgi:ATPase family associated with various cellular activities (AAA)/AAA+ lid domain
MSNIAIVKQRANATTAPLKIKRTKSQEAANEVKALIQARNSLIWIVTREEPRVTRFLFEAIAAASYLSYTWDVDEGVTYRQDQPPTKTLAALGSALDKIKEASQVAEPLPGTLPEQDPRKRCVWILRDLPIWITGAGGAQNLRKMRNLAQRLPRTVREVAQVMIVLSPHGEIPPELADLATVIKWPLPDREEIASIFDACTVGKELGLTPTKRTGAIDAAVGLSGEEAMACFARTMTRKRIDPKMIAQEKKRIVARAGHIEWYDPIPEGLNAVGGLGAMKEWLIESAATFTEAARAYGLSPPKGLMLVGYTGCLHADTPIYDPVARTTLTVKQRSELGKSFHVWSRSASGPTIAIALAPVRYQEAPMIEFTLDNGEAVTVTTDHRFVSEGREVFASEAYERLQSTEPFLLETISEPDLEAQTANVLRSTRKAQALLDDCLLCSEPSDCGAQPRSGEDTSRVSFPSLVDAPEHSPDYSHEDGWANTLSRNHPGPNDDHPSKQDFSHQRSSHSLSEAEHLAPGELYEPDLTLTQAAEQSQPVLHQTDRVQPQVVFAQKSNVSSKDFSCGRVIRLRTARKVKSSVYYDFHVPGLENYWAAGLWHHNCGKSLTAKAIATAWNMPLLRIDLGALKSSKLGSSESNLRGVFETIGAINRCVVWFDEIEKALAGSLHGANDAGVSADQLGSLLQWMQERKGEAFVVMTANDIEAILQNAPELLRKGRFDEIFFVDLPNNSERPEVIKAALRANIPAARLPALKIDLKKVAAATDKFTGAEIASLVPDAMRLAFIDDAREITTNDLLKVAKRVVPMSTSAKDKFAALRKWVDGGNARRASFPEDKATPVARIQHETRQLDIIENEDESEETE